MDQSIRTAERSMATTGDVEARARLGADRKRQGLEGFKAAAADWLVGAQAIVDATYGVKGEGYPPAEVGNRKRVLSFEPGKKYWRVVATDGQRGAFCFLDSTTGDVLKTATWKAPAKHARGNIFEADGGLTHVGPYGMAYMVAGKLEVPLGKRA